MKEVEGFIKDRKNMSANLVEMASQNKQLKADVKQMDQVIKTLKLSKDENDSPNIQTNFLELEREKRKALELEKQVEEL